MSVPVTGADGRNHDDKIESYNLAKGKWAMSLNYRWFTSHRHFVGSVEQNAENVANGSAERDRSGSEVINHVHSPVLSASYGITDRLSLSAELPYFHAHRRSPGSATRPSFVTRASAFSDLSVTARYWLGNPTKRGDQNLSFGLGFKAPTGEDRAEDDFLVRMDPETGARIEDRRPVDQSIQPGDGGWGIVAEVQGFKVLGRFALFGSGSYLANPKEQNDFLRDPSSLNPDPTSAYLSITDQYSARLGVATPVGKNFGVNLGLRVEGVPSSDLIGGDMGRRRPGYGLAIDPGVSYSWKGSVVSLNVPYLIRRVRSQNISDKIETEQSGEFQNGDAAFADYVILIGFSRRF
jgi:hypothetical protein